MQKYVKHNFPSSFHNHRSFHGQKNDRGVQPDNIYLSSSTFEAFCYSKKEKYKTGILCRVFHDELCALALEKMLVLH